MLEKKFIKIARNFLIISTILFFIAALLSNYLFIGKRIQDTKIKNLKNNISWISKSISPQMLTLTLNGEAPEYHKIINTLIKKFIKENELSKNSLFIAKVKGDKIIPILLQDKIISEYPPQERNDFFIFRINNTNYYFALQKNLKFKGIFKTVVSRSLYMTIFFIVTVVIGFSGLYIFERKWLRDLSKLIGDPQKSKDIYTKAKDEFLKKLSHTFLLKEREITKLKGELLFIKEGMEKFKLEEFNEKLSEVKKLFEKLKIKNDEVIFYEDKIRSLEENSLSALETMCELPHEKINTLQDSVLSKFSDLIHSLEEDSKEMAPLTKEVSKIIDTIEEIANEINLLSINATIEATSEEGNQRFSVVASEIRRLSSDTKKATEQIKEIIEKIKKSLFDFVNFYNNVKALCSEGKNIIDEVKEILYRDISDRNNILSGIKEAKLIIEKIIKLSQGIKKDEQTIFSKIQEVSITVGELELSVKKLKELSKKDV